jgi:hypothetical protein
MMVMLLTWSTQLEYRLGHRLSSAKIIKFSLSTKADADIILWHVYALLGNDREISSYTTAIAK